MVKGITLYLLAVVVLAGTWLAGGALAGGDEEVMEVFNRCDSKFVPGEFNHTEFKDEEQKSTKIEEYMLYRHVKEYDNTICDHEESSPNPPPEPSSEDDHPPKPSPDDDHPPEPSPDDDHSDKRYIVIKKKTYVKAMYGDTTIAVLIASRCIIYKVAIEPTSYTMSMNLNGNSMSITTSDTSVPEISKARIV